MARVHRCTWIALALALAGTTAGAQSPVEVRTATVGELRQPERLRASAEVLAPHRSVIAAEITAAVRHVRADVGARVAKGDVLVELDPTDARLALAQAEAQLAAAKAQARLAEQRLARGRELGERNFVSPDELLALDTTQAAATADVAVAEAARAIAARIVEKTRLRAPFDATVVARAAQQGALAVPGTPLVTVVSTAPPELAASIPAALAQTLESARSWRFEGQGTPQPVRLLRMTDALDPAARTREARFTFDGDGEGEAPLPGSTGTLVWQTGRGSLPPDLLVRRDGNLGVFVVRDGRASFLPVAHAQEGRAFAIELPDDALLVNVGQGALQHGTPVSTATPASE